MMGMPGYFPPPGFGMGSSYPGPSSAPAPTGQEPTRSLWLGNIHHDTTDAEVHAHFSPFGIVESVRVCAFYLK